MRPTQFLDAVEHLEDAPGHDEVCFRVCEWIVTCMHLCIGCLYFFIPRLFALGSHPVY